jgi:hypothetical protein
VYSQRIIEANLKRAEEIIKKNHGLSSRWSMRPPSNGERDEMRAHFDTLLDSKGYLIRPFTREETLWVLVESTYCKLDFLYFSKHYARIKDWGANVVYFTPNISQNIVLNLLAENEEKRFAQMFMFLKARRLGLTTIWQMLLAHRDFFYKHVTAYTGSAEETKSTEMVKMIGFVWDNMPYWLRPRRTANAVGYKMEFADIDSSVIVQWGNQKQGIGRGATPTIAHLSEVSFFEKPEELIDASIGKAILENPFGMMALESTANMLGDWWHLTWDAQVEKDAEDLATYKPIFLPWYVGTDLYPTDAWYRRRPAPESWSPPGYVERHAEAAKIYVKSKKILRDTLGSNWEMSRRQMWWYYMQFEEARKKKQLHILLRELPASADEAFQNANPSVFSLETLTEIRTITRTSIPEGVFQVSGDAIPFIYRDQKVVGPTIEAKAFSSEGTVLETFKLEPVETDGWPDSTYELKLCIWEWPKEGEEYGVYCDPSEGVGLDSSVVGVIKKATPWHPDEQVAEWASNQVAPHDLWAYVYMLCHLYTVRGPDGHWREPLAAIEVNINAGDAVQTEMRKRGYSNFYRETDMTQIGETGSAYNKRSRSIRDRIGWRTDTRTRPKMISLFRKMVRDGNLIVRSPELVNEMATLQYNLDKQRIEAAENKHDDRVMGPAILLTCWYDPEIYGTIPSAFIEQRTYEAEIEKTPIYMGDKAFGRSSRFIERAPAPLGDSREFYG